MPPSGANAQKVSAPRMVSNALIPIFDMGTMWPAMRQIGAATTRPFYPLHSRPFSEIEKGAQRGRTATCGLFFMAGEVTAKPIWAYFRGITPPAAATRASSVALPASEHPRVAL